MSFSIEELAIIAVILDEEEEEVQQERKKRRYSVHPVWQDREAEGKFVMFKKLIDHEEKFYEYFRMTHYSYNILLDKIKHKISKRNTRFRRSISATPRLAVCLRYLATGNSFKSISFSYRLGHTTVYKIVNETCKAIVEELMSEVIPTPNVDTLTNSTVQFCNRCKFPNCFGALDGKHITIQAPPNSGSHYFNYKKTFSVVPLAMVDANYNFIMVDVGSYGKNSDGGILSHSNFEKALTNGTFQLPPDQLLPNSTQIVPCVIVGDEAFPLRRYLMRPYPGSQADTPANRNFNLRLSPARRIVENTFGILAQKFRIYNTRIQAKPENVDYIILATCVLHNFSKKYDGFAPSTEELSIDSQSVFENTNSQGENAARDAFNTREIFKNYFLSPVGAYNV